MRERTTWSRQKIASQLRRVAEDPRAMNQDHLQQQPAADAYVIGGPSEFAEDLSPSGSGWKADLDGEGNTKRDEIGMPQYRSDTFNNPDKAPGVSPKRQASMSAEALHAKAELATKTARLMLSKKASEVAVENQALMLMDLPTANLENTLARLAQDQGQDDDDDDDDEGQQKEAAEQDDDEEDTAAQAKQAGELPPEFLENIKKKKDGDDDEGEGKGKDKKARARKAQQQDADEDEGQQKQGGRRKAQQQDADEDEGQQKQARARKAQQQDADEDEGQQKQARARKAQQQEADEDEGQQKQGGRRKAQQQDADDEGEEKVGKEAYTLIRKAATDLLALPTSARAPVFRAMLPSLAKVASYGMEQQGQQQQLGSEQLMAQVQQMVQQAMQQQSQQQPQQAQGQPQQAPAQDQTLAQDGLFAQDQVQADQALVDQMLQEGPGLAEEEIQMDAPEMDLGLGAGEDPALQAIFASDEVRLALEAREMDRGRRPTAARTASTRTVGTRPSAGVSQLGGGSTANAASGGDEINKLASMWSSAPDVSSIFGS